MRIFGLDITSRPSRGKPITCATCTFEQGLLRVEGVEPLESFDAFEHMLQRPGPWVAGLDFPFGQPRQLVEDLGWPPDWEGCVARVGAMTKQEFEAVLKTYAATHPKGHKHLFRQADRAARACSPMMLYFTPVAKMFYQLAPRLMRSGVSVIPCRPNGQNRVAVEAYPGMLARKWIDRRSYKAERRKKQTQERRAAREQLAAAVESEAFAEHYGFTCSCGTSRQALIEDPAGDTLDAVLSAVQAAWACARRTQNYGMPAGCDPLEGCIADPACCNPTAAHFGPPRGTAS